MPNLMVTNACNLACSYCFGMEQMVPRKKKAFMTRETFLSLLSWLKRSDQPFVHIMGGEPTQHPDFLWMLAKATEQSFRVDVFSNGITNFSKKEMEKAYQLSRNWIINVNDPKQYPAINRSKLESLLKVLSEKAVLTFNITDTHYDPSYLFEYINTYKLQRTIKIGITLPTLNKANRFAHPEEFRGLSRSVLELSAQCQKEGVGAEFECGVPYCFFTDKQKEKLKQHHFKFECFCYSILDILPDGNVIYCLPLAGMARLNYKDFPTYPDLHAHMHALYRPYRSVGYKKRCLTCPTKEACNGSCLARIIPAFMGEAVADTAS